MKKLLKEKIGCVFVLCSRCASRKVTVGVDNVLVKLFTKANNKKNRLMSSDFQKINTLYLKLFSIQDISWTITSLVVFVLILIYSCPWRRFFFLSNVKSRELKKIIIIRGERFHECSPNKSCYYRIIVTHLHRSMLELEYEKDVFLKKNST